MRSRHLAVLPAAVVLTLFAAGCGSKKAATATPTATATAAVDVTPDPTASGSSGGAPSGTPTGGAGGGTSSTPPIAPAKHAKKGQTIPVIVSDDSDLTNLETAIGAANLTSYLSQSGQYTFFAPNNDGFAKLGTQLDTLLQPSSQAQLANILKFHIVKGRYSTKQLHNGQLLVTIQGSRLRVTKKGGEILIGNSQGKAQIVDSDMDATNGVVHVIDTVLQPAAAATN